MHGVIVLIHKMFSYESKEQELTKHFGFAQLSFSNHHLSSICKYYKYNTPLETSPTWVKELFPWFLGPVLQWYCKSFNFLLCFLIILIQGFCRPYL